MMSEKEIIKSFIEKRNTLINKLDSKEIDKNEFLVLNYQMVDKLSMKPFLKIDTVEKGIYNYQYYNILAKYHNYRANDYKGKNKKKYNVEINKSSNYYSEKDKVTIEILRLINFENVESYYITMFSSRLKNNIFEIVLLDYEKAIFHSMNNIILQELKKNKVFSNIEKLSKIDSYVNKQ
ncbi:DUF6648 family protein [Miniphocaeibacter massiliensis]|uniref:DUF6648 family protein n=1 Tax=Miniphocaeibacter massiliensis TaxID=2041841 RepID=UPI001F5C2EFD|nr:DUF6648 family protein [Miniphocaeibacter massiliensis]